MHKNQKMSFDRELIKRSNGLCEVCTSESNCTQYLIPQSPGQKLEHHLWLCPACQSQYDHPEQADAIHWRCLNDSIWSENPGVQVFSWRMLHKLKSQEWARDLLDIAYLDEDNLEWAKASNDHIDQDDIEKHIDCFGAVLQHGDNVVLTKTLDVKGATFSAKVGTVVHNIKLVHDNVEQIEGRVNGSMIVILTKYVRKVSK